MIVGSLFSGVGQLDFGLFLAGLDHAFFCESDEWRRERLAQRWPGVPIFPDVRGVGSGAPGCDLLAGGFPCRGASSAGKREGMGNEQTALWREFARIIGELRPRLVLLENVAALTSVDGGRAHGEVLGDLASLGYVCAWDCLPAAAFGAPHLRDRWFLIAADTLQEGLEGTGIQGSASDRTAPNPDLGAEGAGEPTGSLGRRRPVAKQHSAPDASRDAKGGSETPAGSDRERVGTGADDPAPCGCEWGVIDAGGFCACCHAHIDDPRGFYAEQPFAGHQFISCPSADAERQPSKLRGAGGSVHGAPGEAPGEAPERQRDRAAAGSGDANVRWGAYEPAIRRWEEVAGPAPEPLVRGLDARDARRVVRSRLSAHGDGVLCQAGIFLGQQILRFDRGEI